MAPRLIPARIGAEVVAGFNRLPFVSRYANNRGWPYIAAWSHRFTGIFLLLFLWFHLYTLSFLQSPQEFDARMRLFEHPIFVFLEWALAIPLIFHALNGGRIILFELFGVRADAALMRWSLGLSLTYIVLMGFLMAIGNERVTPTFFWLSALVFALPAAYAVASRLQTSGASACWKLNRISAGYLLIMLPAHFTFMHLDPAAGHEAALIRLRMESLFIRSIDVSILLAAVYHAGYGIASIAGDYFASRRLSLLSLMLAAGVTAFSAWYGIRLAFSM
jgi:succinate dehydrogenase cytochrome b556 subunit